MPYSYENSKGQKYYLHGKTVTLQGGREQKIHFFAREPKPGEALTLPRRPHGGGERAHRPALPQAGRRRPPRPAPRRRQGQPPRRPRAGRTASKAKK